MPLPIEWLMARPRAGHQPGRYRARHEEKPVSHKPVFLFDGRHGAAPLCGAPAGGVPLPRAVVVGSSLVANVGRTSSDPPDPLVGNIVGTFSRPLPGTAPGPFHFITRRLPTRPGFRKFQPPMLRPCDDHIGSDPEHGMRSISARAFFPAASTTGGKHGLDQRSRPLAGVGGSVGRVSRRQRWRGPPTPPSVNVAGASAEPSSAPAPSFRNTRVAIRLTPADKHRNGAWYDLPIALRIRPQPTSRSPSSSRLRWRPASIIPA